MTPLLQTDSVAKLWIQLCAFVKWLLFALAIDFKTIDYSIACTPFVSDTLVHKRVPSVLRWRLRRDWGTVPPKKFEVGNGPSIRPLPIF